MLCLVQPLHYHHILSMVYIYIQRGATVRVWLLAGATEDAGRWDVPSRSPCQPSPQMQEALRAKSQRSDVQFQVAGGRRRRKPLTSYFETLKLIFSKEKGRQKKAGVLEITWCKFQDLKLLQKRRALRRDRAEVPVVIALRARGTGTGRVSRSVRTVQV